MKEQLSTNFMVVLCTCPNQKTAESLAQQLLDSQLAACINILPGLTSMYRWNHQIQKDQELLLFIKTKEQQITLIEKMLTKHHPYECPEIIALPVVAGSNSYLQWLEQNLEQST